MFDRCSDMNMGVEFAHDSEAHGSLESSCVQASQPWEYSGVFQQHKCIGVLIIH